MRPELSILSFLCTILLLGLGVLHFKSRNIAVLALILWLLVGNIIQGVNSIIWSGNAVVHFTVWCDISECYFAGRSWLPDLKFTTIGSKLLLGFRVALPAAATCICIHLHFLASNRNTKQRPYRTLIESTACLIFPLMFMALREYL